MPANANEPLYINSFKGINRAAPDHLIDDTQLKQVVNANSDLIGAKTKRYGYTEFLNNPDNSPVQSLYFWEKVDGSKIWFRVSNGRLYKSSVGLDTTWVETSQIVSNTEPMSFAPLQGKLFFSNGVDDMFYTSDGQTYTTVSTGTPPKCKYLQTFQGRIWAAGATTNVGFSGEISGSGPSTVYSSTVNDGTDWDFTNSLSDPSRPQYQYIDVDLNGPITGMNKILNYLIIYKERAFYKFDGSTLIDVNYVPLTSNNSITFYKDYAFFANRDGIWGYPGTTPDIYSIPLYDIINNLSQAQLNVVSAATYRRKLYFTLGTVTLNDNSIIRNTVAVLDFDSSVWLTYSYNTNFIQLFTGVDIQGEPVLIGGDDQGYTYQLEVGSDDDGAPIEMMLETKWYDDDLPQQDKEYTKIYIDALQANECQVFFQVNGGNWTFLGNIYAVISKNYFSPATVGQYYQRIRFKIVDNSTSRTPVIRRLILYREFGGGTKSSGRSR